VNCPGCGRDTNRLVALPGVDDDDALCGECITDVLVETERLRVIGPDASDHCQTCRGTGGGRDELRCPTCLGTGQRPRCPWDEEVADRA